MPVHAVVPIRVLFPKKKENRSARFAKAATSNYLVDVSPNTVLRVVSVWWADLDLEERMCVWTLRDSIAPASQQVTRLDLRLVFGSQFEMSSVSCQFP